MNEIPSEVEKEVLERDNYQCRACGTSGDNKLHLHHWVYRSRGGEHIPEHLITLCAWCHRYFHDNPERLTVIVIEGIPHVFIRR